MWKTILAIQLFLYTLNAQDIIYYHLNDIVHPPFSWINNKSSLNLSFYYGYYDADGSYYASGDLLNFRPILSLPRQGQDNDLLGSTEVTEYVCGFFCNSTCDSFLLAVATIQVSSRSNFAVPRMSESPSIVWSANSARPVRQNSSLQFSQDGNLILRDADGTAVWSTNTTGRSVVGMKLTETGSLMLFNEKNVSVWNSIVKQYTAVTPHTKALEAAIPGALAVTMPLITFICLITCLRMRRKAALEKEKEDQFELVPGLPIRFSFEELKAATNNFCQKLGQGGFGSVFKGQLNGETVAVKRLDGANQGIKQFLAEVKSIGNVHHINLVRLIGFCSDKSNRLLVYNYMSNGSLDKWIFSKNDEVTLDWKSRVKIITDVAKGLAYLHEECRQRIAHLDIKPQNILLDDKFQAKISDFGLCTLIDRDQSHVSTTTRGTRGYMAPEWFRSKITEKADVYSFGVVVMEILCGRKNLDSSQPEEYIHLVSLLERKAKENRIIDFVDSCINESNDMRLHGEEIIEMIKLAMWCLQIDSPTRPSMAVVVKVLEGSAEVETDIEYNFTNPTPEMPQSMDSLGASPPASASLLSGGR